MHICNKDAAVQHGELFKVMSGQSHPDLLNGMAFLFCVDSSRLLAIFCHGVYVKLG
jgi:hypothetical protein